MSAVRMTSVTTMGCRAMRRRRVAEWESVIEKKGLFLSTNYTNFTNFLFV